MKTFYPLILSVLFFQITLSGQFVYGDEILEEEENQTSVQPPISNLQPVFTNYKVAAGKGKTLIAKKDTKITIPPNAFVDRKGNVVKGEVNIHYREFKNPLDIFLSGIPMTIEENGKEEFFQSAGMVEFRADQNGEPVFPNPDGEQITIDLTSNQTGDDYNLYTLDENSGEWNEEGPSKVLAETVTPTSNQTSITNTRRRGFSSVSLYSMGNLNQPIKETSLPSIEILNRRKSGWIHYKKRNLQFTLRGNKSFSSKTSRKYFYGKYFSELKMIKNPVWIYDGPDRKQTHQLLKKISRANVGRGRIDSLQKYVIENIQIIPNRKGDNYHIQFECKNNHTWTIEAYPHLSNNSVTEQKRNRDFYKKYKKAYVKRCEEWKKTDAAYQIAKENFDKELLLADLKNKNGRSRRQIGVLTFGVLNIDKIMNQLNEERPLVFHMNGEQYNQVQKIYVLDQTNNAVLSYFSGQKIRFDKKAKNSLIVALEDDSFATISESTFQSILKKSEGKEMVFTLENLPLKSLTLKALSDALAVN